MFEEIRDDMSGTTTYVATGSADTAEIDIPLQTVMGAANEDLVIELGAGSGDFLVDVGPQAGAHGGEVEYHRSADRTRFELHLGGKDAPCPGSS